MKVINISLDSGVPNKIEEEKYNSIYEGCGENIINNVEYPQCFCCGESTKIMVRLINVDDGCMNDYLCMNCISKIHILPRKRIYKGDT